MSIIKLQDVHKTFKVSKRAKGLPGIDIKTDRERSAIDGSMLTFFK